MIKNGLYREVNEMYKEYDSKIDLEKGVWQVIGFRQFLPWLKGEDDTPDNGIASMKQATRKYAKRQTKWIKKKLLYMTKDVQSREEDTVHVGVLDATDLNDWSSKVSQRGVSIAKDFLNHQPFMHALAPAGLEHLLDTRTEEESFSPSKWKHFTCDVCFTGEGNPHISIGQEAWDVHVKSRRHRQALKKQKRQREIQQWKENKKQECI